MNGSIRRYGHTIACERSKHTTASLTRRLKPTLGQYRLCDLRASHLQAYYQSTNQSAATLQQHHAILHSALKAAVQQDLIPRNAASLVIGKPRRKEGQEVVLHNCWEVEEARQFLNVAKGNGPRAAAFYVLALDSGMRKAELCGLQWKDLDLDQRRVSIVRQLVKVGPIPIFGPPKNGKSRSVDLDERTIELLRKHKAAQAAHRLLPGTSYQDHGLIFTRGFGQPLTMNNLGQREYARLIKQSGVKPITFHGMRHTCATLSLKAEVPVKVISKRLGHKRIEMTLNIYAHALPSMQQAAAVKLGQLLHG